MCRRDSNIRRWVVASGTGTVHGAVITLIRSPTAQAGTEFKSLAITLYGKPSSGFVFRSKFKLKLLDPSG
jgi:hypothetical protein